MHAYAGDDEGPTIVFRSLNRYPASKRQRLWLPLSPPSGARLRTLATFRRARWAPSVLRRSHDRGCARHPRGIEIKTTGELMQAHACAVFVDDVPILDGLKRGEKLTFDIGLLVNLTQCRFFGFFIGVNKPFRKLPAPPLAGANNGNLKRVVPLLKDHVACGDLLARRCFYGRLSPHHALQFAVDSGERLRLIMRV